MFVRNPITPVAKLLEPRPRYYGERGTALKMDTLRRLYTIVVNNIRKAREKLPKKEEEPHKFKVNDMVLVKDPDAAVFEPRYQPNFRVTAIFGNNRIEVQDERGHKSIRRSAHLKYIAPSDKVVNQLPSEQVVKNYGRSSKLLLAEKDIPDLHFEVKDNSDPPEKTDVMELINVNTEDCVTEPWNSEFQKHSRNSLENVAGEAQERVQDQRSLKQALDSELLSNTSEYREHSQNSRKKQPAGVETTVSAEDATTTAASGDFSKHSQTRCQKVSQTRTQGRWKRLLVILMVGAFGQSANSENFLQLAGGDRSLWRQTSIHKPVCISEPNKYSRDSLGVGNNVSVSSFSWLKSMSQIVGLTATWQDKVEGNPTGANTASNAKVNISPVHTEFNFFLWVVVILFYRQGRRELKLTRNISRRWSSQTRSEIK